MADGAGSENFSLPALLLSAAQQPPTVSLTPSPPSPSLRVYYSLSSTSDSLLSIGLCWPESFFSVTMSFARPARCLFCSFSRAASVGPRVPRRQFHVSIAKLSDESRRPPNSKTLFEIQRDLKREDFKPYTPEEKARLAEEYTPEQMAAIEAGERSIDSRDLANQFAIRQDPMKLEYLDDFSVIEPGVDKHIRAPESNSVPNPRLKSDDDFTQDFSRFFAQMPEDVSVADWVRYVETLRVTRGKAASELNPHSALVPDFFGPGEKLSDEEERGQEDVKEAEEKNKEAEEMTDALKRLMQDTGLDLNEIRALKTKTLVSHSVVNQTRLGKVRRQYSLAIAGNGGGLLGIGEAKSEEAPDSMLQSKYRAIRNMQPIPRYEGRTIFGDVQGKVGAVELKLMTRPPGMYSHCLQGFLRVDGELTFTSSRIRTPLSASDLRNVSCRRYPRPGSPG